MTDLDTHAYRGFTAEQLLNDLDRCEHGRHMQDDCLGCPDGNRGNPRMNGEDPRDQLDRPILAYGLGGMWIYVLVSPDDHLAGTYPVRLVQNVRED